MEDYEVYTIITIYFSITIVFIIKEIIDKFKKIPKHQTRYIPQQQEYSSKEYSSNRESMSIKSSSSNSSAMESEEKNILVLNVSDKLDERLGITQNLIGEDITKEELIIRIAEKFFQENINNLDELYKRAYSERSEQKDSKN